MNVSSRPLKIARTNFTQVSVNVTCGRGSASSDAYAISHVLQVLWINSCFHIMQGNMSEKRLHLCFVQFARWRHRVKVCRLRLQLVFILVLCGRLSWLLGTFLLHVKYHLSYRIVRLQPFQSFQSLQISLHHHPPCITFAWTVSGADCDDNFGASRVLSASTEFLVSCISL